MFVRLLVAVVVVTDGCENEAVVDEGLSGSSKELKAT